MISVYGEDVISGIEDFRARYAPMFARGRFGGEVTERMVAGPHCVERELWWREDAVSGERLSGEVLVRYTLRDQTIGAVVFMRAEDPASVAS